MESGFVLFFLPGRNLKESALERQLGDLGPWASRRALRPCSQVGTACGTSLVPQNPIWRGWSQRVPASQPLSTRQMLM